MEHPKSYEIVIIGGAVIGSSIAFWLSLDPSLKGKILVIERDPSYAKSSTALSAASIRLQFSNPINIAISKFGVAFIRDFQKTYGPENGAFDLGFKEHGYLFLANTTFQCETLRENHEVQRAAGAQTILLDQDELKARYPILNVNDIKLASLGTKNEGWFDNMGLLNGLKEMAKRNGVRYLTGEVNSLSKNGPRIIKAHLTSGEVISGAAFVNAAGPRANQISNFAGIELPVEPRKRTTFVLQCPTPPPEHMPLIVDHTGAYIKPEGQYWMAATQPKYDPAVDFEDFEPRHQEFEDEIWPKIAARAEIFESVRVKRFWAGHYAYNTLDQNAIVGLHPSVDNFYFANGFSGHGLQQAPAIGRGIAELMLQGSFQSLDLSALGFSRIISGSPFLEKNIV